MNQILAVAVFLIFSGFSSDTVGAGRLLQPVDLGHGNEPANHPSGLTIQAFVEDGKKYVNATLKERTENGEMIPVEGEEILFEVERMFGLLPVSEFTFTDERGEVKVQYPDDIPGDEEGNIIIVVRLDEHAEYEHIEIRDTLAWGIPLSEHISAEAQNFWMSEKLPFFPALIYWGSMFAVLGIIVYGILYLFKINDSLSET